MPDCLLRQVLGNHLCAGRIVFVSLAAGIAGIAIVSEFLGILQNR